jgi:DNA-binding NarL/FixJ family response regulator
LRVSRIASTAQRAPRAKPRLARAALVATGPRSTLLDNALTAVSFTVDGYPDVERMLEADALSELSIVVLTTPSRDVTPASLVTTAARALGDVPIVIACASVERWDVRAMLAAGASGVVLDSSERAVRACIAAVQAGQTCVPREHSRQVSPPSLSAREKQILGLLVMGYMNSQIAERLYLAESTVKSHLSSAFGKLGVRSRNQAVDLILDPERGLGTGILGLVEERLNERGA